jgi:hypothetical protein
MLAKYLKNSGLLAALLVVSACGLHAQWYSSEHWNFDVGAGVTPAVRNTGNSLNTGWHYQVGAGYNFTPHFGTMVQFQQNNLAVSNSVLASLSVPGGDSRIYSVTLDPIWHFRTGSRVGAYAIGGVGWYRRTVDFTQPTTTSALAFDPFFGLFFPVTVPANQVIGSVSSNAVGWNGGFGFTIGHAEAGPKFFTEARYHWANTTGNATEIVPITFGVRW